ncbi:uncharacterized protein LOC132311301 [Cornus florida]|uniref:uncharacterized protein LOC132311301 n=1 Tax=Cornus florida TaxID=4283 RepID=UPI00289B8563|nr:uncharacterized protein LOC132311301 [Cornus florida]
MQQHKREMEPNGSDCGLTNSRPRPSSKFFKIILHSSIHEKKLRIPEKFVRKYGDELSAVSILTVPTGQVSHVALEKTDKMIWFCDGWQQFMEHHSISYGSFLVFKYKGNSSFDVLIFDLTATEIQYPCSKHDNGKQFQLSDDEEEIEDDDSVDILGSSGFVGSSSKFSPVLNKKGKSADLFVSKNVENLQAQTPPVSDQGFNLLNESELKDKRERIDVEEHHPTKRAKGSQVSATQGLIIELTVTEIQFPCSKHDNGKLCQLSDEEEIEDDDSVEILGSSGFVGSSSKFRLGLDREGNGAALLQSLNTASRCLRRSKRYKKDQEQTIELENLHGACGRKASRSETSNGHDSLLDKSKRKDQFVTKNVQNLRAPAPPVLDRGFDRSNESKLKDKTYRINEEEQNPTKIANSSHVATQRNKDTSHQTTNQRTVSNGQESLVKRKWCKIIGINTCSTGGQVINQARERAINAARMFKSENPFHTVILRPYNVNQNFFLVSP